MEHSSCHLSVPLWGFVPAAGIEETSQLWGSFSVNIDLWQERRMDFRKKSLSSGCCHFQCDVAGCLYCIASQRDEVPTVVCMKMHICDAHLSFLPQSSTWKAGRVLDGMRRNSSHTNLGFSEPSSSSCLFIRANLWYLMSWPVIQSLMLSQGLFSPPTQWYCRQLFFLIFLSFVITGIAVD